MRFGIPKECGVGSQSEEKRVALSPAGVRELVEAGGQVILESGAALQAGFQDEAYRKVGAHVVYTHEEALARAEMVIKIGRPTKQELELISRRAGVMAFWHMAVAGEVYASLVASREITALGYEIIQDKDGTLPILKISSEIAGKLAPQIAGRLLETTSGGVGMLLGGAPGIPPADVVIIGAGILGFHAARAFLGVGCKVYVLDHDQRKLEFLDRHLAGSAVTAHATREKLEKFSGFAEVLVGAVLVPGEVAPIVVTTDMVKSMKRGSVILDFSIDQGGCVETTRLQGAAGGVFVREGIVHFAVANCPSFVARTSTHAMTNALLPFLKSMQEKGLKHAMQSWRDLRRGCYLYEGKLVSEHITAEPADLKKLLGEG